MWAERGGLDFEGRARWDAWAALRGLDGAKARLRFVKVRRAGRGPRVYRSGKRFSGGGGGGSESVGPGRACGRACGRGLGARRQSQVHKVHSSVALVDRLSS